MTTTTPTQTRHPWRATARTAFAVTVALLTLLPVAAVAGGVDAVPGVVQVLGVAGAVTRVLALPQVDAFMRTFLPWLASTPDAPPASAPRDYPY